MSWCQSRGPAVQACHRNPAFWCQNPRSAEHTLGGAAESMAKHRDSAEDLADADADVREEQGGERRVAAEDLLVGVGVAAGLSMSFDAIRREVHEPRFGD